MRRALVAQPLAQIIRTVSPDTRIVFAGQQGKWAVARGGFLPGLWLRLGCRSGAYRSGTCSSLTIRSVTSRPGSTTLGLAIRQVVRRAVGAPGWSGAGGRGLHQLRCTAQRGWRRAAAPRPAPGLATRCLRRGRFSRRRRLARCRGRTSRVTLPARFLCHRLYRFPLPRRPALRPWCLRPGRIPRAGGSLQLPAAGYACSRAL